MSGMMTQVITAEALGGAPGRAGRHRRGPRGGLPDGLERGGRRRPPLVRATGRRRRAAGGARPGRQPVGVPGRGAALVGDRVAPGQRARRAAGSTARSAWSARFEIAARAGSRRPIAVLSFADEEGARFNTPTFGSKALAARLDLPAVLDRRDDDGVSLAEAMRAAGIDPEGIGGAPGVARAAGGLHRDPHRPDDRAGPRGRAGRRGPLARRPDAPRGDADRAGGSRRHDSAL